MSYPPQFFFKGALALAVAVTAATAQASIVVSDDFSVDSSADYTEVNVSGGTRDGVTQFAYDYSADGIASAPNTTDASTLGLRITVNDTAGADDAATLFHNTPINYPVYTMTVDMYMGVTGTGGTTEFAGVGVAGDGVTSNTIFSPISSSGHFLSITGEGGSSSDYRHSTPSGITNDGDSSYLNSTNTTNATGDTYQAIFPATDFPGSPGNSWATLSVDVNPNTITYSINGTPIITDTFDGSDGDYISLNYADVFSSIASPLQSQFVIFDNVQVAIPEPASAVMLGLAALGLVARRR